MTIAQIKSQGKRQTIILPKEIHVEDTEVLVKQVGQNIMIIPKNSGWKLFFENLKNFSEDYMIERQQPPLEKRNWKFE